jgi:hypothetical protein
MEKSCQLMITRSLVVICRVLPLRSKAADPAATCSPVGLPFVSSQPMVVSPVFRMSRFWTRNQASAPTLAAP